LNEVCYFAQTFKVSLFALTLERSVNKIEQTPIASVKYLFVYEYVFVDNGKKNTFQRSTHNSKLLSLSNLHPKLHFHLEIVS
jgi:hypothetical protein